MDALYDKLNTTFERSVLRKKPTSKSYPPWFNSQIIYKIKQKSKILINIRELVILNILKHLNYYELKQKWYSDLLWQGDILHFTSGRITNCKWWWEVVNFSCGQMLFTADIVNISVMYNLQSKYQERWPLALVE